MSYSNPNRQTYSFGTRDTDAGDEVFAVLGPKGKAGRVYDYGIMHVTEAFTATTLPCYVSVGTVADADAYAEEIGMGTAAIDSGGVSMRNSLTQDQITAREAALSPNIPADTIFALHVTEATGGTPAGIGIPFMVIDWDD